MRIIAALTLTALLAACGVGGEPKHPEETTSFSGSLRIGTSHSF
ncbi:argininosuccinate lyase [Xinfangfangia sp. D13-10-4-6]|nr:argininosuccinate lyase [Pseudogemmobacter hezensis]NPD14251.1 argininosuccinate lyase [Pseudogemmobacter hezensis]